MQLDALVLPTYILNLFKMRDSGLLIFLFLALTLSGSAAAIWVPSLSGALRSNSVLPQDQQPIMNKILPGIIKPQTVAPKEDLSGQGDGPVISDVLPKTKGINIFASLTRDFDPIASRLNDASKNITVLAPRNSAVQDLPRKPWEDPEDYQQQGVDVYEGQGGQDRARRNLQRFVEAHLLPASPWRQGEEIETLGGEKLKWTKDGDKILIQPGNIEVDSIAEKVANGEVWVLNGVINYRT